MSLLSCQAQGLQWQGLAVPGMERMRRGLFSADQWWLAAGNESREYLSFCRRAVSSSLGLHESSVGCSQRGDVCIGRWDWLFDLRMLCGKLSLRPEETGKCYGGPRCYPFPSQQQRTVFSLKTMQPSFLFFFSIIRKEQPISRHCVRCTTTEAIN